MSEDTLCMMKLFLYSTPVLGRQVEGAFPRVCCYHGMWRTLENRPNFPQHVDRRYETN